VPGDDDENGEAAAHLKAEALDPEISRYRPLVVIAEHGTSAGTLQDRATWETLVRMGRGKRGRCTVRGWRSGQHGESGSLWMPNTLVHVKSDRLNLDGQMLVVGCTYTLTEQGQLTEMTFARREAFELVEGIGRSRLKGRLNDKTQREKRKKGDPPREWLVTDRLTRLHDRSDWRGRLARWICINLLDYFDPSGRHCGHGASEKSTQ